MGKLKLFFKVTVFGGVVVLLPVAIFAFLIKWLVGLIIDVIDPLSDIISDGLGLAGYAADIIVVALVIFFVFLLGMIVKTRFGEFMYTFVEARILKKAPGYSFIRESVAQFLGNERPAFSQVALARVCGDDTLVTAFIIETHADGRYTIFVPQGPNPTSGNVYHVNKECVQLIDIPASEALRSIISCGAGSGVLLASDLKE